MGGRRWTQGETEYLIRVGSRHTDSQIAKRLGRTTDAINSMRMELGIRKVDRTLYDRIPKTEPVSGHEIVDLSRISATSETGKLTLHPSKSGRTSS